MISVLSVIHYPFFGGPHNQILRLAEPLARRGYSTTVVIPDEPGNAFARFASTDIDVRRIPLGRIRAQVDFETQRRTFGGFRGDVTRLRGLVRSESADLVVVHGLVNPHAAFAGRLEHRPVVWQLLDTRNPRALRLALAPLIRSMASTVMTTGEAVARAHPGIPRDPRRVFSFYPPVDTRLFTSDPRGRSDVRLDLGFDADAIVVGCVANFTPQKGLETFLAVAERLSRDRPDVRFALFGSRMETQEAYALRLLERAESLLRDRRLVIRSVGSEVPLYMSALDVFLATAVPRSEGITTTILEAMSTGMPVVTTDVGAIREAVVHGRTGYVVPPGDERSLHDSVKALVDDADARAAMGAAARERALALFDVERCADVHAKAFAAALATSTNRT